jgi:molybdenum cofactor cytidylyltransferase
MYLTTLAPDQAIGQILRHNLASPDGRKLFSKGRRLRPEDAALLRANGIEQVRVAVLEPGDVHEDAAAQRLAEAVCGAGLVATDAAHSRVNLLAQQDGVVEVDADALLAINSIDGLTVATLRSHSLVRARQRAATIKIIPFAVREEDLARVVALAQAAGAVVQLRPLRSMAVGVLLVGSASARARIERGVQPAIEARVIELGSRVAAARYVAPDEGAVAEGLLALAAQGAELIITAGETSIMDRDDVTPLGIRRAGGQIEHYGAPVEPGNLLLLAYLGALPILGAPGCVRSRDINIVDLLLPRLLAGEHVTKQAIVALGHGGLL